MSFHVEDNCIFIICHLRIHFKIGRMFKIKKLETNRTLNVAKSVTIPICTKFAPIEMSEKVKKAVREHNFQD
jgi:hypothetical protein